MPRSAVKLTPSTKGRLWDLQNRALDLETKLTALNNAANKQKNKSSSNNKDNNNSEAVDRLRIPLCETMAEILLANAEFSWHYDVVHRLWKHCFYDRIVPQRVEIAKAKKKNNKQTLATSLEASLNHFLAEAIVLYEYLINHLEKKLLPEEDASYTQTQSSTQATTTDDEENLNFIVPVLNLLYIHLGDLYRYSSQLTKSQTMYEISAILGPGHGHAYNQIAVICQLKEQSGISSTPLSVVALYWYCRSLLPTVMPFNIATSNLNRLFASNRQWLLQQQQQQQQANNDNNNAAAVVVTHATKAAAVRAFLAQFADLQYDFYQGIVVSNTNITTSNSSSEQQQPASSVTDILKKINKLMESLEGLLKLSAFGDALVVKMITILAFSECHVPTLATVENEASNNNGNSNMLRATTLVARTTTYQMATLLADRVLAGLRKIKASSASGASGAKNNNNTATTTNNSNISVRLLLPLLLVAEFTAHREATCCFANPNTNNSDNSHNNIDNHNDWMMVTTTTMSNEYDVHYKQALHAFWKKMVDVWNLLHPLAIATLVDETKLDGLQEYEALRGFAPFSSFITPSTSSSTTTTMMTPGAAGTTDDLPLGFLTAQESVQVILDKNYDAIIKATKSDSAAATTASAARNSSTQETNSTKGSSSSSSQLEQGRIKIARMLALAKSLADDLTSELGLCICRMSTGEYAWIENKQEQTATMAMIVPEEDDNYHDHAMVDNFDSPQQQQVEPRKINNSSHVAAITSSTTPLVYQQAAGGGPALLVPGALLQNQGLSYATLEQQQTSTVAAAAAAAAATAPTPQMNAVAQFGNAGFDSSRLSTTREPSQQQQQQQGVNNGGVDLHSMLLGGPSGIIGMMQPPAPVNPPPGFFVPPPPDVPIAGFDLQNMGLMPPGLLGAIPPSQPMQSMSDSLHLLGGVSLTTANPFASTTVNNNNSMYDATINGSIIPPLRHENISFLGGGGGGGGDEDEMAGVDLLGSGLLHSLWGSGEDNNGSYSTRNPFYTAS